MSVNAFEILIKSFQTVKRRVNNFTDYPYTNIIPNVAMLRERECDFYHFSYNIEREKDRLIVLRDYFRDRERENMLRERERMLREREC